MNENDNKKGERAREGKARLTTTKTRTRKQADRWPPSPWEMERRARKEGKGSNVCNNSTAKKTHTPNKEKSKYENRERETKDTKK